MEEVREAPVDPAATMNKLAIAFCLFGIFAVALSGYIGHEEYDHHPEYSYEYKVHDPHTGDIKSAHESRHGDVVKGYYTLKEADGTTREVHYTADKHHGFQAEVKKIGHAVHYHQPSYHHY